MEKIETEELDRSIAKAAAMTAELQPVNIYEIEARFRKALKLYAALGNTPTETVKEYKAVDWYAVSKEANCKVPSGETTTLVIEMLEARDRGEKVLPEDVFEGLPEGVGRS
jgi:hypothetical protein